MIRAVVWKELREQGLIGLTLVVLGSGVLAGVAALADPPAAGAPASDVVRHLGAGLLATLMLAVTAGMVCGGAVFAAEREAGTMAFLDSLPASRGRVWRAKLLAGVGLAVAQIALLLSVAAALGFLPTVGWVRAIGVFGLLAFVWGVLGSTVARTTLGAVGVALAAANAAAFVVLVPILLLTRQSGPPSVRPTEAAVFLAFMFAIPLALSAWVFTGPDRLRAAEAVESGRGAGGRARLGVRALVWVTARQLRTPGLVLSGFAVLTGLVLLVPGIYPFLAWPSLALAAGVLAGVTAFADEQTRGVARFWGEQRLPVGRAWAVKVGSHALLCLWLLLLLALPSLLQAQFGGGGRVPRGHSFLAVAFRSPLFDEIGRQGWKYLVVPAVYGFVAGHLCGLLFKKLVVACGVAGIVGGVGAVAWGPSLLAGGVSHWQLWLPPALALVTARLLIAAWASDRLATRGPLAALALGCLAVVLATGAGLAYRVLQVPDRADGEEDVRYVASLPPIDVNKGGGGFRTAAERYARTAAALAPEFDRPAPQPGAGRSPRVEERLLDVVRQRGWTGDPELAAWLDRAFVPPPEPNTEPWPAAAEAAAAYPVGVYEYPQLIATGASRDAPLQSAGRMAIALLARGLQLQAAGDPGAFVSSLRTVVALARTLRNGSTVASFQAGVAVEQLALLAIDQWLGTPPVGVAARTALAPLPQAAGVEAAAEAWVRRVSPSPALLRAALGLLEAGDPTDPFDPTPHFLAERHVVREALKSPAQWLPNLLAPSGGNPDAINPEADLVAFAWAVPWERERTRRLVGLGYESGGPAPLGLVAGRPGARILLPPRVPPDLSELERILRGERRASLLKLGLRAYRADRGRYPPPAEGLPALVTGGYLRRVPPDPHDETRPFSYRLTPPGGETLRDRPRPSGERLGPGGGREFPLVRFVPGGEAVVWSVGPDKVDQGGVQLPVNLTTRPEDLVYLVPPGPNL